jgi:4'-phosphopantetheinyl transferase
MVRLVRTGLRFRHMNQHTATLENPKINWPVPPALWSLGTCDVHIWAATLLKSAEHILLCHEMLSPDELDRASRFHFDRDRNRFIIGRGSLRAILGRYLNREPGQLQFDYNARGKPALAGSAGEGPLHFNLAHSNDLMLLAVTRVSAIGVDVERLRPLDDAEDMAEKFFSACESSKLKELPNAKKSAAFFNLWTRKEAWLKATGEGIAESLNQVQVSFLADEPARLISLFGDTQAGRNWHLCELNPAAGFVAAVAVAGGRTRLECWHWTE